MHLCVNVEVATFLYRGGFLRTSKGQDQVEGGREREGSLLHCNERGGGKERGHRFLSSTHAAGIDRTDWEKGRRGETEERKL